MQWRKGNAVIFGFEEKVLPKKNKRGRRKKGS